MKIICTAWNGRQLDEDLLCRALLQYRNTPARKEGLSPAQKLHGRPVQDTLLAHRRSFLDKWQKTVKETDWVDTKVEMENYYNRHTHALHDMVTVSHVAIQNSEMKSWDIYGTVVDITPYRHYYVKTQNGYVIMRNCQFIRHRAPLSLPSGATLSLQPSATSNYVSLELAHPPLQRFARLWKPTKRLIDDPNW